MRTFFFCLFFAFASIRQASAQTNVPPLMPKWILKHSLTAWFEYVPCLQVAVERVLSPHWSAQVELGYQNTRLFPSLLHQNAVRGARLRLEGRYYFSTLHKTHFPLYTGVEAFYQNSFVEDKVNGFVLQNGLITPTTGQRSLQVARSGATALFGQQLYFKRITVDYVAGVGFVTNTPLSIQNPDIYLDKTQNLVLGMLSLDTSSFYDKTSSVLNMVLGLKIGYVL